MPIDTAVKTQEERAEEMFETLFDDDSSMKDIVHRDSFIRAHSLDRLKHLQDNEILSKISTTPSKSHICLVYGYRFRAQALA